MLPMPFNNPTTYEGHSGIDFGQRRGTPFLASGPGTVSWLGSNSRGGNFIWVSYDGYPRVGYHHMDSHDGCPAPGTRVQEGTRLGYVGNSGNSTGPHLHSEVEGYASTSGYWRFFDRNRVVGSAPAGGGKIPTTPSKKLSQENDMDFINIQGKVGSHRAGVFAVYNRNDNKNLVAKRLSYDTLNPIFPTFGNAEFVELKKIMPFLDV